MLDLIEHLNITCHSKQSEESMFKLIDLPYAPDALAPVIKFETILFHHGKHLQTYVDNLNKLLPGSGWEDLSLEEIVVKSSFPNLTGNQSAIFNNAGQVLNHNLYFTQFKTPDQPPVVAEGGVGGDDSSVIPGLTGNLKKQIEKQWGTFDAFKAEFEAKGVSLFGSGWVWLQTDTSGKLSIAQYAGADNPVAHGLHPLLTFDVWEHAYYLDYQNRRAAHLSALWQIVNWAEIEKRYQ